MMFPIRYTIAVVLLIACSPRSVERETSAQITPRLETSCSSSAECKTDSAGCRYCYNGHCSCTLPTEPLPVDAGAPDSPWK